jgi:hypothetical protein
VSSCLIVQTHDDILIGADSASSTCLSGKFYRVSDDFDKIHVVDNYVLFISGEINNVNMALNCVKSVGFCMDKIQQYLVNNSNKSEKDGVYNLEMIVCGVDEYGSVLYQFSEYNQFNPVIHRVKAGNTNIVTAGFKSKLSSDYAYGLFLGSNDVISIYTNTFDSLACNEIGGTLSVYRVSDKSLVCNHHIYDNNTEYIGNHLEEHLLIGDVLVGRIVAANNLHISNDKNNFRLDETGAWLNNANFTLTKTQGGITNTIVLDPSKGFTIYKGALTDANRQIYLGTDGNVHFKGNIDGGTIGIGTGSSPGGYAFEVDAQGNVYITRGRLNIGNNFSVDQSGNTTMRNATMYNAYINGGSLYINGTRIDPSGYMYSNDALLGPYTRYEGPVQGSQIPQNAITANHIQAGSINASKIVTGSITADLIAAGAITANMIRTGTLGADVIYTGKIDALQISSWKVGSAEAEFYSLKVNTLSVGNITVDIGGGDYAGVVTTNRIQEIIERAVSSITNNAPWKPSLDSLETYLEGQISALAQRVTALGERVTALESA